MTEERVKLRKNNFYHITFYLKIMIRLLIVFITLVNSNKIHAECTKEIYVMEYKVRMNPSLLSNYKTQEFKQGKKNIQITCELHKSIKKGDRLRDNSRSVDRFRFFSGDQGLLEHTEYEVIGD